MQKAPAIALIAMVVAAFGTAAIASPTENDRGMTSVKRELTPVNFSSVTIDDVFWEPRMRTNREQTIPHEYKLCKTSGHIDAFRPDWTPGKGQQRHIFYDSDLAKWIEAASYSLATHPDPALDKQLDEVIDLMAKAQQPDGYLNTYFIYVEPDKRWTNLRDRHELYCAGHLMEAAVAHYYATGKRSLLDVMCRYADYIDSVFGTAPGKKHGYPGHEEIELALVKLYHATGNRKHLELSKYFVDERGRKPYYYDIEAGERGENPAAFHGKSYEYNQAHLPVREQTEVTGHAVRAMYLYSGMADLAGEYGDESLVKACERLWDSVCVKRMYITGGIGPSGSNEGFTTEYDLPNESAYAETCAAIGLVFWSHRMLQLGCDGKYADVMERALYNGALSGVSLDGTKFFYVNPLASSGKHHRQDWFGCACCPPNICRLLASLGQYVYSQNDEEAVVHLYVNGSAKLDVGGRAVALKQKTDYPWDGRVSVTLETEKPEKFAVKLRIPGWCRNASLSVNGEQVDLAGKVTKGYGRLEREWKSGDKIELNLPMPIERIFANPRVNADFGRVALQRGPVAYCLESVDNKGLSLGSVILPEESKLRAQFEKNLLGGVVTLTGDALVEDPAAWDGLLYRADQPERRKCKIKAVPYHAWDNREPGEMVVWLRG